MFRLLPKRYLVSLGEREARLFTYQKGLREARLLAQERLDEVEPQGMRSLDMLKAVLGESRGVRKASLVLHDDLVAYATLPWPGQVLSQAELAEFAGIRLKEVYGTRLQTWKVCAWQEYRSQGIACAFSPDLLEETFQISKSAGVVINEVRPVLAEVVQLARIARPERDWLAVDLTSAGCLLALHSEVGWVSVRFVRYSHLPGASPGALIEREARLLGVPEDLPIVLHQYSATRRTSFSMLMDEVSGV